MNKFFIVIIINNCKFKKYLLNLKMQKEKKITLVILFTAEKYTTKMLNMRDLQDLKVWQKINTKTLPIRCWHIVK